MSTLYIIRGLPGSGKSTLAKILVDESSVFEADMYFIGYGGQYNFDSSKLNEAHKWCQSSVELFMNMHPEKNVAVSNTSTTEKEVQPYLEIAYRNGYKVVSIVLENRHGGKSVHDVPNETLIKMKNRFSLKL